MSLSSRISQAPWPSLKQMARSQGSLVRSKQLRQHQRKRRKRNVRLHPKKVARRKQLHRQKRSRVVGPVSRTSMIHYPRTTGHPRKIYRTNPFSNEIARSKRKDRSIKLRGTSGLNMPLAVPLLTATATANRRRRCLDFRRLWTTTKTETVIDIMDRRSIDRSSGVAIGHFSVYSTATNNITILEVILIFPIL